MRRVKELGQTRGEVQMLNLIRLSFALLSFYVGYFEIALLRVARKSAPVLDQNFWTYLPALSYLMPWLTAIVCWKWIRQAAVNGRINSAAELLCYSVALGMLVAAYTVITSLELTYALGKISFR